MANKTKKKIQLHPIDETGKPIESEVLYPETSIDSVKDKDGKRLNKVLEEIEHDVKGLANVAYSGEYTDLLNRPTPDWNENDRTSKNYIDNKPTDLGQFTNSPAYTTESYIDEYYYNKENINSKLAGKQDKIDTNNKLNASLVDGLATVATSGDYDDLTNKPDIPDSTSDLLNDSGFITKAVNDLDNYYDETTIDTKLDTKQNNISDLETIRSGAEAGATAVQPNQLTSELDNYYNKTAVDTLLGAKADTTTVTDGLATKQDNITNDNKLSVNLIAGLGDAALKNTGTIEGQIPVIGQGNKIDPSLLPDQIEGQMIYGGTVSFTATADPDIYTAVATLTAKAKQILGVSTDTIILSPDSTDPDLPGGYKKNEGIYYIAQNGGKFANIDYLVGDWLVSTGSGWSKIANTDAVTDITINGATILASGVANINTQSVYNASTNKIATMQDIQTSLTDYIQKSQTSGLVKNDGTIDTNTYLTEHQDISGKADISYVDDEIDTLDEKIDTKQDIISSEHKLAANLVDGLATIATTGDYDDLTNKPDLSIYAENSDLATVATSGDYNDLANKPTIPDVSNFIQKSQTAGLVKNDGTIDDSNYYILPNDGKIPGTDLAQAVRTSLALADSALQDAVDIASVGGALATDLDSLISNINDPVTSEVANLVSLKIRGTTYKIDGSGGGEEYTAGAGITISANNVISVSNEVLNNVIGFEYIDTEGGNE